jgi:DNA-binding winged helix-turn-helix (wHTH) protein
MASPGQVLRRAELETAVWGEPLPDSDTLRSHMHTLRRALTADGESQPDRDGARHRLPDLWLDDAP